jgi:hypothetical protein
MGRNGHRLSAAERELIQPGPSIVCEPWVLPLYAAKARDVQERPRYEIMSAARSAIGRLARVARSKRRGVHMEAQREACDG